MPSGLLQRLQCGVALEALGESGCSFKSRVCFPRDCEHVGAGAGTVRRDVNGRKANTLGVAAHLSSLSTPFSLMQLAMMMADSTLSLLLERSIFSVGFVPLSSSI